MELTNSDILYRRKKDGTVNLAGECRVGLFEYFYMFVMVIYMAQMTDDTGRMVGGLSGNPIPFLIPFVLTIILLYRKHISWHCSNLWIILSVTAIWSFCCLWKYKAFTNTSEVSYIFFLFYAIIIAYIHIKVFGRKLFPMYENIMVRMCQIAIVFWILNMVFYSTGIFNGLEETILGRNICYIYQWQTPDKIKADTFAFLLRNAGFSWEPGRFAIMLGLALYVNLSRKGITFKNNTNVIWILAALVSTQSTTGYCIAIMLYAIFAVRKGIMQNFALIIMIIIPVAIMLSQLDFMQDKIMEQMSLEDIDQLGEQIDYNTGVTADDEYLGSLGRFESVFFELQNIANDPIIGYSRNANHSFFYENISPNYVLTNGLFSTIGKHGIIYGLFIYAVLLISSIKVANKRNFRFGSKYALFLTILFASFSYTLWTIPIFTAFWMYGFIDNPKKRKALRLSTRHSLARPTNFTNVNDPKQAE